MHGLCGFCGSFAGLSFDDESEVARVVCCAVEHASSAFADGFASDALVSDAVGLVFGEPPGFKLFSLHEHKLREFVEHGLRVPRTVENVDNVHAGHVGRSCGDGRHGPHRSRR